MKRRKLSHLASAGIKAALAGKASHDRERSYIPPAPVVDGLMTMTQRRDHQGVDLRWPVTLSAGPRGMLAVSS